MIVHDHLPELVHGAVELEATDRGVLPHRLPGWARAQNNDPQLTMAEAQPSGVRLAFRTRATTVELDTVRTKMSYVGAPPRPDGVYDVYVDGVNTAQASVDGGDVFELDMTTGGTELRPGPAGTLSFTGLPDRDKTVEIWLPFNERTELAELRTDAPAAPLDTGARRTWLHHGSSISHGSFAASSSTIWPALAARAVGVELTNLGFGGGALLDPFTARTMRDTAADLISVKIGINVVNADLMRLRAFGPAVHGFLDTIREGHPDAPLLVVGPTYCEIHETTPGPCRPDFRDGQVAFVATGNPSDVPAGRLTLEVIRAELARIVEQRAGHDGAIHYLDGRELYSEADAADLPLVDGLHPDPATHELIGARFAARVFGLDGAFAG